MVKDASLSLRIEQSLKDKLEKAARESGVSLATFAEEALQVHAMTPKWVLSDPEVTHVARTGTAIKLNVAHGWPVALMTISHANVLGKQLMEAAETAKKIALKK